MNINIKFAGKPEPQKLPKPGAFRMASMFQTI
jgi:hypothetical protein